MSANGFYLSASQRLEAVKNLIVAKRFHWKLYGDLQAQVSFNLGRGFVVDKWPDAGIIVMTPRDTEMPYLSNTYNVCIMSQDVDAKDFLVQHMPWKSEFVLAGVETKYLPLLDKIVDEQGGKLDVSEHCSCVYVTENKLPDIVVPDEMYVDDLRPSDAGIVNDTWKYGGRPDTLEFLQALIPAVPTVCLRHKDTHELVAYEIYQTYGAIGMLYVLETYRGRGLAKLVTILLVRKLLERGLRAFALIEESNAASLRLHTSLGFTVAPDYSCAWMFYTPPGALSNSRNMCT